MGARRAGRQAKQGDQEAFDSLARMIGDGCMAIAFRILRDYTLLTTPYSPR